MGTIVKQAKAYSYIRLSSALQRKGHGRQRQFDKSVAYATANNLDLVSDPLEDIGISAYKGKNITEGVLGRFIEAAEAGKIEPGSFLLVESLDRLSRQQVERALGTFLDILKAGIAIVTLGEGDRRTYVPGKVDISDLVMTIMIMGRAHEESQTKADRIRANWANKRANARVHPMTAMCPAWLQLSKDRKSYREIEKRVETVRWIFDQAASGLGIYAISRRLHEQKVPHFGKSNGWHQSYLIKILKNRAVLGEFQPHKVVNDKRQPDGKPIPNYFPAVVSEETFSRVQYGLAQRRTGGAGRKGKNYSNLFSGLSLQCEHCKGPAKFENKGSGPKGGNYLVCDNTRRGRGCSTLRWRYEHFEASVLHFLYKQIDLASIVRGSQEDDRRYVLDNAIEVLEAKRHELQTKLDTRQALLDVVTDAIEIVAKGLDQLARELRQVEDQLTKLTEERNVLVNEAAAMADADVRSLIESLQGVSEQDRYKVRSDLASALKKLASRIDVWFAQPEEYIRSINDRMKEHVDAIKRAIEKLKKQGRDVSDPMYSISEVEPTPEETIEELVEQGRRPRFSIVFKTGQTEEATPDPNDPFDPELMSNRKMMEWLAKQGYDISDPTNAVFGYIKDHTGPNGEFVSHPSKNENDG